MISRAKRKVAKATPANEVAAQWVLLLDRQELSEDERRKLEDWLLEDKRNVEAFENASWALDATSRYAGTPAMLELRKQALAARPPGRVRRWYGVGAGAAATAAALIVAWIALQPSDPRFEETDQTASASSTSSAAVYRSARNERSIIELADGSVVTLDTQSELTVDYSSSERAVHLVKGQALFEVAHGKPIPFRVYAGGQRITAIGTTFNVRLDDDRVGVSMVEGVVRVRPRAPSSNSRGNDRRPLKDVTLTAGDSLVTQFARPTVVRPVDPVNVRSWTSGRLVFNDTPLREAVMEVNRYAQAPIRIADPAIGRYRISGVFKSNDPERFARAMGEIVPVVVTYDTDGSPVLKPRDD